MKILSMIVGVGGAVALLLAVIVILTGGYILGGTAGGWLRLASGLFLLAIFIVLFDKTYLKKK